MNWTTKRDPVPGWVAALLVALALLLLLSNLAHAFALFMRAPLNPDVPGFLSDARAMRFFYDCPTREPFHVLWLRAGLALSEDAEAVARLTTLVQTLLVALALYAFGAPFFGRPTALTVLFLFCSNPVVRFYGVSGLRDPLFAGCVLLFGLLLFRVRAPIAGDLSEQLPEGHDGCTFQERRRRILAAALAGAAGALMALTRVYGYAILAGGLLLYALRERAWRPERRRPLGTTLLIAGAAAAALLIPDVVFRPRSPIHAQTVNLFRNLERTGEPGSWQRDPPVGHFQYLFGEHSLPEIAARVAGNYARYAYQYLPFYMRGYEIFWVFLPLGAAASCVTRRAFVAGLFVLSLAPVVFVLHLNQVPGVKGIENRFVYQAFPFALLLVVHGVFFTAERLLRLAAWSLPAARTGHARLLLWLLPPPGTPQGG